MVARREGHAFGGGLRFDETKAVGGQGSPQEAAHLEFVFDEEHQGPRSRQGDTSVGGCSSREGRRDGGGLETGSDNRKVAPPPARFSATSFPPWASTMPRQMASPRPAPLTPA